VRQSILLTSVAPFSYSLRRWFTLDFIESRRAVGVRSSPALAVGRPGRSDLAPGHDVSCRVALTLAGVLFARLR